MRITEEHSRSCHGGDGGTEMSVAVEDEGYGEEGRAKVKLDEGLPDNSSFF